MRRALVTGGSGFLGSHIAEELAGRGWTVTIFDRSASSRVGDHQMVEGSLADREALTAAAAGCEAVFHLAALSDLDAARERPVDAARDNVLGTVNALEAARLGGAGRFLFASTVYVYSRAGGFYRASKQAGEAFVEEYRRHYGLPYTILRYGSLYGPRSDERNGFHRLLAQAAEGGPVRYVGTPEDTREYIHVTDAARLSVDALEPEHRDRHLTLTGAQPLKARDLFTMFEEILGRRVEVEYVSPDGNAAATHYRITPYSFSPKTGRRMTPATHVDMGQGILELLERWHHQGAGNR